MPCFNIMLITPLFLNNMGTLFAFFLSINKNFKYILFCRFNRIQANRIQCMMRGCNQYVYAHPLTFISKVSYPYLFEKAMKDTVWILQNIFNNTITMQRKAFASKGCTLKAKVTIYFTHRIFDKYLQSVSTVGRPNPFLRRPAGFRDRYGKHLTYLSPAKHSTISFQQESVNPPKCPPCEPRTLFTTKAVIVGEVKCFGVLYHFGMWYFKRTN